MLLDEKSDVMVSMVVLTPVHLLHVIGRFADVAVSMVELTSVFLRHVANGSPTRLSAWSC